MIEILAQFVGNKPKGRISKRVFQDNKLLQIFRKTNTSYPKKCSFFQKFGVLCLLKHPFSDSTLLSYYQRTDEVHNKFMTE